MPQAGATEPSPYFPAAAAASQLEVRAETFTQPSGFDLAAYWRAATERLDAELNQRSATIRVSAQGLRILPHVVNPYVWMRASVDQATDSRGWHTVTLPAGSSRQGSFDLLRLGAELEVIEPPDLRQAMAETAARLARLYDVGP